MVAKPKTTMLESGTKRKTNGIGTLQETSLHASLKDWYSQPGDHLEVAVDGYVIDIVRGDLLIEIQTRNFYAIKRKLQSLVEKYTLRLVYPLSHEKWIISETNTPRNQIRRRKSPRHADLADLFSELVRLPELVAHDNFSLEVLLIREEEIRRNDGKGSWRRKGWSICDRRLLEVVDRRVFQSPADFSALLPESLPQTFNSTELAQALGKPRYLAQKMAYCLRKMDAIHITGKDRNSIIYTRGQS